MKKPHYALIMAGGQGTRFWPWSTAVKPKQFLPVAGSDSLLSQTYARLKKFVAAENIYVIAERRYWKATAACLPDLPRQRYIVEPAPRNTAPSLIMANIVLARLDVDANLLVVPADHFIPDEEVYAAQMSAALTQADEACIVTAGIPPTMPHTGYGYIRFDEESYRECGGQRFYQVLEFKEKPDRATAQLYMEKGNYFWNAGMFIYKLRHFREFLAQYSPYYFACYRRLEKARGKKFAEIFLAVKPDSIDYALMEKVKETRMVKARFYWNDVGSWSSLMDIGHKDGAGNVSRGGPVLLQTTDSLVYAMGHRPVAVIGLHDVAIVDTADGLLVSSLADLQRLKEVFQKMKEISKD